LKERKKNPFDPIAHPPLFKRRSNQIEEKGRLNDLSDLRKAIMSKEQQKFF